MVNKIGNKTFDFFKKAIESIQDLYQLECQLSNLGIELANCEILGNVYDNTIKLLNCGLNLKENNHEEIPYYCWERSFGTETNLGDVIYLDEHYPLNSTENLWDYLAALEGVADE